MPYKIYQLAELQTLFTIRSMKLGDPIGKSDVGPLLVRLAIGAYFVLAGLRKIDNLQSFIQVVQDFHLLPKQLAPLYGIMVPYLEVGAGALLILGFWTTLAGIIASILLITYIIAIGIFPHQSSDLFNKDIIILAGTLCLLYTGSGMLSVDKFRKSG